MSSLIQPILASDDSSFVAGIELFADGGMHKSDKSEEMCYEKANGWDGYDDVRRHIT
jgi:hypothetical protein